MLWVVLLVVVLLLVFEKWIVKDEEFDKIPGPKGTFLLGNTLSFLMDPVKLYYYFKSLSSQYKDLYKLKFGPRKIILIHNPEDVEAVISGTKNTTKGFLYRFLEPWLKEGLLLSDGQKWYQRRKILTPAFHFKILRHFSTTLEENSQKLVENLSSEVDKPETNITSFITDFTLNSICETAMGTKLDPKTSDSSKRYKEGIQTFGKYVVYRSQRIWMYPSSLFSWTAVGRKQNKIVELLRTFRCNVVNKRRENNNFQNFNFDDTNYDSDKESVVYGKKKLAMLDLLLQAENEGIIDADGTGEEVDTFMFEGHDTTSTALQFTFMLLANNPESQSKAVEECDQIFGSSNRAATMNDLGQMKYLESCIKESLRLYPPVHFILRKIDEPMKLKNYNIPAGTDCVIFFSDMQRRTDQFVEPLKFKPERFQVEPTWHPYAYLPFSAGPRNCIGQKFAMMEMKLVLSAVLRRYRLLPVTRPQDLIFITDFILRPTKPILVKIENRN